MRQAITSLVFSVILLLSLWTLSYAGGLSAKSRSKKSPCKPTPTPTITIIPTCTPAGGVCSLSHPEACCNFICFNGNPPYCGWEVLSDLNSIFNFSERQVKLPQMLNTSIDMSKYLKVWNLSYYFVLSMNFLD